MNYELWTMNNALFPVYPLFPINIVRGKGCHVWDDNNNQYLDLYGGHAVISIGHAHPHYVEAISRQVATLGFYSNSVVNKLQEELAQAIRTAALPDNAERDDWQLFFINSGAEANENALKLASFYNGRTRILAVEKAFHGRTSLAVEATANPNIIAPINANNHVTHLPLNDIALWQREIERGDVAAVIIECIQGVGGIRMVTPEFYKAVREACTRTGTILICDEIQCGYGRSGKFFAHQWLYDTNTQTNLAPDLITMAKGIANGFPMGAVLISPKFEAVHGQLGTTFGGNHLACAAALSVLDAINSEKLIDNAREVGDYIMQRLHDERNAGRLPHVTDVRGRGLMIGIELDQPYKEIRNRLLFHHHIFTGCSGTNVIRLLPPLCLTKHEAEQFIQALIQI